MHSLLHVCAWTVVIGISLVVAISVHRQEIMTIAKNVARAYIDKDILYRKWNALHGGVYLSTGNGVAPNPYLPPSVFEKDLVTPSGRHLTLVNPAYMTRQIYELAQSEQKVSGRITSLKPLRPENKADQWETAALQDFERGALEVSSQVTEGYVNYLRLMRPLITEESCLACHGDQGYNKGDIRGGISVKLPMTIFEASALKEVELIWVGHFVIWLSGLAWIYAAYTRLRSRTEERDLAEEELKLVNAMLESQATTDSLTGIFNRRKFTELLEAKTHEARRYGIHLSLIFFDIDKFKTINDTYGHETGDNVLQQLTGVVSSTIRQTDYFARFGGEEFVVLINGDAKTGTMLAGKMRELICGHRFPQVGTVTASFGVAEFSHEDSEESFIKRADDAMFAAKLAGRNQVVSHHG